jgi:UDP-GlcNAc:undecaprenyl-phosphate/decaprenyl-phosphate GlcNAc-1-phosphate transferase
VRTGILDLPVGGKIHERATPLLGGAAVYLAFALAAVITLPFSRPLAGLVIGGFAAVAVGVLDERITLSPPAHLAGQLLVALVAIVAGVGIVHSISLPWGGFTSAGIVLPGVIGFLITLFWLVGMINTVNFLDGMDGLATGVAALAALMLAVWAAESARYLILPHREELVLPLALAGALFGFLPYNWHRASIFLGDSGSVFLGLALGSLSIIGPAKLGTALLVLIIPILDVAWAIVRRRMQGRSFLAGDKQHVYHRMLELGVPYTHVVLSFYVICVVLGIADLFLHKFEKLLAFVLLVLVVSTGFVLLEIRAKRTGARPADARSREGARVSRPPPRSPG